MTPTDETSDAPFVSAPMGKQGMGSRKKLWILVGAAVLVIGIIAAMLLTRGSKPKEGVVAISDKVAHVSVASSGYTPLTIKIKKGQEVTWTNQETSPHRLAADQTELPGFETTEPLSQGDSYTYIFLKSGTYRYYDPDAPKKYVGTIVVE